MDLQTFTSFDGRIGRKTWWLATIVMIIAIIVLYAVLGIFMFSSMMSSFDPNAGPEAMLNMMNSAVWLQLIMTILIAYPATALMKKRLNDRDRPNWVLYVFWLPTILGLLLGLAGMNYEMADQGNGTMMPQATSLSTIVGILALVVGIWSLVELGFLRGTDGANQHGADPLA
jgi:uncharacterized membrane protein YhaH (DUF805 family)